MVKRVVTVDDDDNVVEPERKQPLDDVEGWVVRYTGASNIRKITRADWLAVGIDHDEVVWRRDPPFNVVSLKRIHLSPDEFQRCIESDQEFVLEQVQVQQGN